MSTAENRSGFNSLASEVAADPYFRHVMGCLIEYGSNFQSVVNHEVTDWHEEMREHARENYKASDLVINTALLECAEDLRQEEVARGEA